MTKLISKAVLAGLGFMSLTREAIQQTVKDLVDQSKLSEAEGRRLIKEFERQSAHVERKVEQRVHVAVHNVLQRLDLTNRRRTKARKSSKKKSPRSRRSRKSVRRAS